MQYYDKKEVGTRIKMIRSNKNITQCKLAEYLDYTTERQLQRIECGETACSVDKLMEIAQILDVSTDFLLFGGQENKGLEVIFEGRSEGQRLFMRKLMETVVENFSLLL